MKQILFVTCLIAASVCQADDPTKWKSLQNAFASDDKTQTAYGIARCSGLYYSLTKSMQSRTDTAALADQFQTSAVKLQLAYATINLFLKGQSNVPENQIMEQVKNDQATIVRFANGYTDRMGENFIATGSHFAEDPFMRQEMLICNEIQTLL
ncbi:hypothetical protein N8913_05045 [Litoricola sp.]|nr:hypothetical protein [Litorivicinus sp.]